MIATATKHAKPKVALLWDKDGSALPDMEVQKDVGYIIALKKFGFEAKLEDLKQFVGTDGTARNEWIKEELIAKQLTEQNLGVNRKLIQGLLREKNIELDLSKGLNQEEIDRIFKLIRVERRAYLDALIEKQQVRLARGIKLGLKALKSQIASGEIAIAIVTSDGLEPTQDFIYKYGLEQYLTTIVTKDCVERRKPYPDPYLLAAKNIGIDLKNCIIIEDSFSGLESALTTDGFVIALDSEENPLEFAKLPRIPDMILKSGFGEAVKRPNGDRSEPAPIVRVLRQAGIKI